LARWEGGGVNAPERPKRSFARRVERWMVGVVMAIIAIVLERVVLRSIRKKGEAPAEPEPTAVTSRGGDVDLGDAR
jgi:hypothetical protein